MSTTLPSPHDFDDTALAAQFPAFIWPAQQPLSRVHRALNGPVHFSQDRDGRFNPPQQDSTFGTWYLSSHPRGRSWKSSAEPESSTDPTSTHASSPKSTYRRTFASRT